MAEQEVFKARSSNNVKNGHVFVRTLTLAEDHGKNLTSQVVTTNGTDDYNEISGKFDQRFDDVTYYG